jgi:sugar O-acyltransferase (sialic acid O-acetyltransferase NeuD family)
LQSIIVIGSGRYTGVVIDIILAEGKYKIEAILCDYGEPGTDIMGHKVIGKLDLLNNFDLPKCGIVAIGDNYRKEQNVNKIISSHPDFDFVSTIHPSAVMSKNVEIGNGTAVHASSVIKFNARIGNHCDINSNTMIAHDVVIGDYTTIGAGVMVGGYTKIGQGTSVNMGSIAKDRITIGDYVVIGMGSVVAKNVPSNAFSCGNPSRVMRQRAKEDGFL